MHSHLNWCFSNVYPVGFPTRAHNGEYFYCSLSGGAYVDIVEFLCCTTVCLSTHVQW